MYLSFCICVLFVSNNCMLLVLLGHVCIYCTDRGIVRSYQKYLPETYKRFKGEKVNLGREAGAVSRLV